MEVARRNVLIKCECGTLRIPCRYTQLLNIMIYMCFLFIHFSIAL